MKYCLIRFIYSGNAGSVSSQWISGETRDEAHELALKAYFSMCNTAVNSSNEVDTVILLDGIGVPIRIQRFQHEVSST